VIEILAEQLFNLEHDASRPAAERDRMRRELARRLNDTPVYFSPRDERMLTGAPVRTDDIVRPPSTKMGPHRSTSSACPG
jgi:hypothetical protein